MTAIGGTPREARPIILRQLCERFTKPFDYMEVWKAQVNLLREFAEQNGKPTWRATRVPQFGYYGNLWREFLKSIGYDALRGRL